MPINILDPISKKNTVCHGAQFMQRDSQEFAFFSNRIGAGRNIYRKVIEDKTTNGDEAFDNQNDTINPFFQEKESQFLKYFKYNG